MRSFKKLIAVAVFSLACVGSTAVAAPQPSCDFPCWKAYQACIAVGTDAMECQFQYDKCIMDRCGPI